MSLMSVGRLFQTSGPLTENARRPNCVFVRRTTADLVELFTTISALSSVKLCPELGAQPIFLPFFATALRPSQVLSICFSHLKLKRV